jgi:hypothetical protein
MGFYKSKTTISESHSVIRPPPGDPGRLPPGPHRHEEHPGRDRPSHFFPFSEADRALLIEPLNTLKNTLEPAITRAGENRPRPV